MTVSKSKFLTTCAASVLLAVALSACGGGGGSGPATDGDDMMPDDGMMPGDGDGDVAMEHEEFVGEWSADWPGGGRTELEITSVSADGQVTGTFRHQQRGREPIEIKFSPNGTTTSGLSADGLVTLGITTHGIISVVIEDGTLRFSYEGFTFVFTFTEEESLQLTIDVDTETETVTIVMDRLDDDMDDGTMPGDGDGDDDDMMPPDSASQEALANVIDLVANNSRRNAYGKYISGWWHTLGLSGTPHAVVSGTFDGGGWANVITSYDENRQLHHNVAVHSIYPRREADPYARSGRYINTQETPEQLEGVTRSVRPLSDHGLGSVWQVTELEADYDNGGTLSFYVATDVQPSDGALDPYSNATEGDDNIEILGTPALRADEDFMVIWIDDGDTIGGSLGGVAGNYSCANADGCLFVDDRWAEGAYTISEGVAFTPDGGTRQQVTQQVWGPAPTADYMAFGYWLYVPEDVTDAVNYDFGVFASGGDPFETANLAGLTGTAAYEGDAVGMYYVNGLSSSATTGSFTADVRLEADFGNSSDTGFISGEVNSFVFEGDVASSLPSTVALTSDVVGLTTNVHDSVSQGFGVTQGSTNIFSTHYEGEADPGPYPGGHIAGWTQASVNDVDWNGEWHGAFYGNGSSSTDHPTGVAGIFSTSSANSDARSDRGLTGSFGAHRQ
ncbi:MAG: hypothetical protein OXI57_02480 [Rhodospirillales bacterium]|nr:hypothetical protein [Rhodospirillales bacterium]